MTWVRMGDTVWTNPKVLALADDHDPRQLMEAWGFLTLVASLSAQHQTDYVITLPAARMIGGDRTEHLLETCRAAGLVERTGRGRTLTWRIVEDEDVLHLRLREAVRWERQQRADTGKVSWRIPILIRDGDACRWCARVVQPNDNRSARGRTFDHIATGEAATGPADLVIACRGCNGARGRDWQNEATRATFDDRWQLLPAPERPYYAPSTATWLADHGHPVAPTLPTPDTQTAPAEEPHQPPQGRAPASAPTTPGTPHQPPQGRATAPEPPRSALAATGVQPVLDDTPPTEEPHLAIPACATASATSPSASATERGPLGQGTAEPGRVGHGSGRGVGSGTAGTATAPLTQPPPRRGRGRRRPRRQAGSQ